MEKFRAIVRPFIGVIFSLGIVIMAIVLISKYGNIEFAKQFMTFILATGATIIGFYFGERSQKPKP